MRERRRHRMLVHEREAVYRDPRADRGAAGQPVDRPSTRTGAPPITKERACPSSLAGGIMSQRTGYGPDRGWNNQGTSTWPPRTRQSPYRSM
jgi:hypothetical protein